MRVLLINYPNTTSAMTEEMAELATSGRVTGLRDRRDYRRVAACLASTGTTTSCSVGMR